jgi:NADH-quinone oxidoreductase subunit N
MGIVIAAYSAESPAERARKLLLVLLSGIGALSLALASHLLVCIAAWQLTSLPLTLAAVEKKMAADRARALLTVFLADFFSFALLSLGVAFLFAQYQTLSLELLSEAIAAESQNSDILLYTGTALWLAGLLVRVGGVPFHMPLHERTQSGGAGISGFAAVLLCMSATAFAWSVAGDILRPTLPQWRDFLSLAGILTLWAGSLGALVRPSWRHLTAYVLIAQSGWLLMTLASDGPLSLESECYFFVTIQAVALLLLAFANAVLEKNSGRHAEEDIRGLAGRDAGLAFLAVTALLVLGGFPPAGFVARFMLLARLSSEGLALAALLAGCSTIALAVPCVTWAASILASAEAPKPWAFPFVKERRLLWVFAVALWIAGIWPTIVWPD